MMLELILCNGWKFYLGHTRAYDITLQGLVKETP